jgi:hypothetical protein
MAYEQDLRVLDALQRKFLKALHQMAFNIRAGTPNEQVLYNAIFSNQTRFPLSEVALLAYYFSSGPNDLRTVGAAATDAQVQTLVDGIKAELISRQNDTARPVVGLSYFSV